MGSCIVILCSISFAALLVNVTAISPKGLTTLFWISHEILEVNTLVLPLPAPARMSADSF